MNERDMAQVLIDGGSMTCAVPFFGDHVVSLDAEDNPGLSVDTIERLLTRFLAFGKANRLAASHHVHAYFKDLSDEFVQDALSPGQTPPATPDDVWRLVTPGPVTNRNAYGDPSLTDTVYMSFHDNSTTA